MKIYKKELLWTILEIWVQDEITNENIFSEIFEMVKIFEEKYSRFKKWNYLYNLNILKEAKIDTDLETMINISKKVNEISNWYFDITLLPFLENNWYGIFEEKLKTNFWMQNIILENKKIILKNNIMIDLGWIWKWYLIDVIFDNLKKYYNNFVINFWWDLRISGKQNIFLEDPTDQTKNIWKIEIENLALASSGSSKRKIKNWHHLINPKTWTSEEKILWVYVTHKFASFADSFATALFVSPLEISLEILKKVPNLEAMIITSSGDIYKTNNFKFKE